MKNIPTYPLTTDQMVPAKGARKAKVITFSAQSSSAKPNSLSPLAGHKLTQIAYDAQRNLQFAFNSHEQITVLVDDEFKLLLWNKMAAEFLLKRNLKVRPKSCFLNYCSPQLRELFRDALEEALSGQEVITEMEGKTPDDKTIYWKLKFAPAIDNEGNTFGVLFIGQDITELKTLQLQVSKQCQRLKSIAWKQCHVVRSPLANIKGLLPLFFDDTSNRELMECLRTELDKLDRVIISIVDEAVKPVPPGTA